MKIYSAYIKPKASDPMLGVRMVREGFNWWAFLLAPIWALYNRMWLVAAVSFLVSYLDGIALKNGNFTMSLVELGWYLAVGMFGNDWLVERLKRRGYRWQDVIAGRNLDDAMLRFFDRVCRSYRGDPRKNQADSAEIVAPV